MTGWHVVEAEHDRADVRALLAHHFAEMRADSPPEACHVLPIDALRAPDIRLFSLRDEAGALLGVGAIRTLDEDHVEIKSMRTDPAALGRGVGRAILDHLLDVARRSGASRVSLETGNSALFAAAHRLYVTAGFERCGPFGDYRETPFTVFYSTTLS